MDETTKTIEETTPDVIVNAAAKVGGIKANVDYPANFINDNLQIQTNLISSSYNNKVKKLILFGPRLHYPHTDKQTGRQSVSQSVSQPVSSQSVRQSVNQSVSQPVSQSISQSVSQAVSQSV